MVYITIIVSFILDSIVSNFISLNSVFTPLFTLMSLLLIYPYFKNNNYKYLITCFVSGLCYDLIYTDTIIIHGFLFLLIGFIVTRFSLILSNSFVNILILAIVCIVIYRFITYGLLLITANTSFKWIFLFKSIYKSILMNLIYVSMGYIILEKLSPKLKIRRLN